RSGTLVINPPKSMEAAVDKFLTSELLCRAGLKIPTTICCQTSEEALDAFELLEQDVVVKPLFGGEGRGITRITDRELAVRAFRLLEQMNSVIYLQPFIPHHGFDIRVFLIGSETDNSIVDTPEAYCIKRTNHDDWRSNVSRGATTEKMALSSELLQLAQRAANAIGAPIVGVDLLPALDGSVYVLEVNAVPGWRALAKTVDVDIARRVLDYAARQVAEQKSQRPAVAPQEPSTSNPSPQATTLPRS
ncbi:MAG: RimK family alpha-L-glutamate ligase, partial [Pirellulaceae bacterium]